MGQTVKSARRRAVYHPTLHRYAVSSLLHLGQNHDTMIVWRWCRPLATEGRPAVHQWGRSAITGGACVKL